MFSRRTEWNLEPNRYAAAVARHRALGREVFDLTESNPTRCGLHYPALDILKSFLDPRAITYVPDPRGMLAARRAVASYYYGERGETVDPENIVLTTSTSEAYSFLFRLLCDPGDEVLVPTPSYPLFEFLAGLSNIHLIPYELVYDHGWQIDFDSLRGKLTPRARAVMVVHPNNPTGSFAGEAERAQLDALCVERKLALVADEVFLDYALDGQARASFTRGDGAALTFALSGLSKVAALPQMKVAWVVVAGPAELRRAAMARLDVIADTFLSMNAPVQHAIPALLTLRHAVAEQLLARVRANLAELDAQLAPQSLVQRLQVEGGWYVVLRVPATASDEERAISLLEQQDVLVHPGHFYDFHRDGFLVVSLIPPTETFAEGARRLLHGITDAPSISP